MFGEENAMRTKHDVLTEEELASFRITHIVEETIKDLIRGMTPSVPHEQVNILDWGCAAEGDRY